MSLVQREMSFDKFELFVEFGEPIPNIGDKVEVISFHDKTVKNEELTIYITYIEKVEWDMKRHGIIVFIEATFKVDRAGLKLI